MLISTFVEIIVDSRITILYSLKYGKVKRCRRVGRARPGQSPRRLSLAGAGRTGRSAGGPGGGSAQAPAEYPDLSLRPAAWSRSRDRAQGRPFDDLCGALRNDECAARLSH